MNKSSKEKVRKILLLEIKRSKECFERIEDESRKRFWEGAWIQAIEILDIFDTNF